jgi:hypothetical protein
MKLSLKPTLKKALLAIAAAGLVASVVTGREKPSLAVAEPAARVSSRVQVHQGIGGEHDLDLAKLERPADEGARADPFANRSFAGPRIQGPAQKAVALAPPTPPAAPPLPFQYFGKLTENGKTEVYVMRGAELISIARGQTIGAEYRIDQVSDSSISFTYLPLKMKQTMDLQALNR